MIILEEDVSTGILTWIFFSEIKRTLSPSPAVLCHFLFFCTGASHLPTVRFWDALRPKMNIRIRVCYPLSQKKKPIYRMGLQNRPTLLYGSTRSHLYHHLIGAGNMPSVRHSSHLSNANKISKQNDYVRSLHWNDICIRNYTIADGLVWHLYVN